MALVTVTRDEFLQDRQGRTFTDLCNDSSELLDAIILFFNDESRQRRMQESEIHHDRAALAGVVRELECQPVFDRLLTSPDPRRSQRLRQAVGVVVRMVMEKLGWKKAGRKGSLGVRAAVPQSPPYHNTGGLAFWFLRAERYELPTSMPFVSVKKRCRELKASRTAGQKSDKAASRRTRPVNGAPPKDARRESR